MCDLSAANQSIGRSISVTWVDSMVASLGILILIGFWVTCLFNTGQDRLTYVSVQVELAVII